MAIYFSSDHHFGHPAARSLYRRPFCSVSEMDRHMIAIWNAVIKGEDEVWHLGDFAVRQSRGRIDDLLGVMHGRKHLLVGNNDDEKVTNAAGWCSVLPYAELSIEGRNVVLCHYPFRTWRNKDKGWINLHGHSHGRLKPLPRQFDVGVDARDFRPVTLADLIGSTKPLRTANAG